MSPTCWRILGLVAALGTGPWIPDARAADPSEAVTPAEPGEPAPAAPGEPAGDSGDADDQPRSAGIELGGSIEQVEAVPVDGTMAPQPSRSVEEAADAQVPVVHDSGASLASRLAGLGLVGVLLGLGFLACLGVAGAALFVRFREPDMSKRWFGSRMFDVFRPSKRDDDGGAPAVEANPRPLDGVTPSGDEVGPSGTQIFSRTSPAPDRSSLGGGSPSPHSAPQPQAEERSGPEMNAAVLRPGVTTIGEPDTGPIAPFEEDPLQPEVEIDDGSWTPSAPPEPTIEDQLRDALAQLATLGGSETEPSGSEGGGAAHMTLQRMNALHLHFSGFVGLLKRISESLEDGVVAEEAEFLEGQSEWVRYFGELLDQLVDEGQCIYTDPFGDEITFTAVEEWMDAFAVGLLDPLADRLSYWERYQLEDVELPFQMTGVYHVLLGYSMNLVLAPLGFAITASFPLVSGGSDKMSPVAGTMKVVGQEPLRGFEGCVVGTRVVGLMRDRRVYRIAEVVTG